MADYNNAVYIRAFGDFYKVAYIASSVEDANAFMAENEGTGLIIADEENNRYWIAENAPSKF